jgi:pimeloyl-ACP methyl ester carboxylesterase
MPMIDRPVALGSNAAALHGTLTVPEGKGGGDAVLIWSGSGPTDRDGNSSFGLKNNSLKMLAHALGEVGFMALRTDKRGIGESARAAPPEADLRFETYVEDAARWARFLKEAPGVRNVFLLGHSEGALVATLAAQRFPAAGLVLVAGTGFPAAEVLRRQLAAPDIAIPPDLLSEILEIMAALEEGRLVPTVSADIEAQYRPSVQPYLMSWFGYDPAAELARIATRTVVIQGANDLQVSMEDAERLAAARPDIPLIRIEGMNHVLKTAPKDRQENFATYTLPLLPLAAALAPAIARFLTR